ncbi:trans-sulfuration enzyme family protein [Xylanimonas protaetiae]|uniref:homocysteine desulfhydrase n=1 Tax=Xylanimonas protaetiae TaxID=2509457 RepID=A0A4P6F7T6_9MICO|nr:PLP-dependent transferase [Xylanimonas protaetiae]QAY71575.1 cystathionine gamma-synthase [Xylanimonas protaetiae]
MPSHEDLSPATVAVAAGRPPRVQGGPVNAPVVLSSTYVSQGDPGADLLYARIGTETWRPFEEALGRLEGAAHPAVVYGSGMAAVAAALSLVPDGGVLVVPRHAYQVSLGYADDLAARHGVEVRRVDIAETAQVVAALEPAGSRAPGAQQAEAWGPGAADVALIESPTNPMLEVADLPALLSAARERGVTTVVDNTFATPLGQNPLALGADVVLHSVTKYLAGHSDVVLGACVTNDPELDARLRAYRTMHGSIAGPMEVWLALRGLRTLALRVERAQANAAVIAERLAAHPAVAEVRHPSLPADPGHERAKAQMRGFGAIVGLRPVGGAEAADAVVAALRLWVPATSLGGVESTLERRRRFATESPTVPEDLLRMSVGIEDVEDLWADLDQALRSLG